MQPYFEDENSMYRRFTPYEEDSEDAEFLKCLYPPELMQLQLIVEEECDKLEFEGSVMFDQYPDKVRILNIVDKVENKYKDKSTDNNEDECIEASNNNQDNKYDKYRDKPQIRNRALMEVMVINEIMRRRIRKRNCHRRGFC